MVHKKQYKEIWIEIQNKDYELLSHYLEEFLPENCIGYYEIMYDETQNQTKKFIFYFLEQALKPEWEIETLLLSLNISDYYIDSNITEEKNYWEEYKDTFKPFLISKNFFLVPIWHKDNQIIENKIPIYIEPGMAFGTGFHPSTQLMMEWIDENLIKDQVCLDAGCGSGILSIALLKKNAKQVIAFDIDQNAIESTKKNLNYNFSDYNQKFFLFLGSWDLKELQDYHFDIILANLTLPIFQKYFDYIKKIITKKLVISGISEEQQEDCNLIFQNEYIFINRNVKDGWLLLEYQKRT